MTIHPDEGVLRALLDGELSADDVAAAEGHLRECAPCRAMLDETAVAAALVREALPLVDRPAPVAFARSRIRARRRRVPAVPLRWAAVFLLVTATALSATVPGSPLRDWWHSALRRTASAPVTPAPVSAPAAAPEAPTPVAGVAVSPAGGRLRVALIDAAPGLRVEVHLGEGDEGSVTATGDAARARFATAPGSIEVRGAGPGRVEVSVPAAVKDFSLRVNGRLYLASDGASLRVSGPTSGPAGPEIGFEVPR